MGAALEGGGKKKSKHRRSSEGGRKKRRKKNAGEPTEGELKLQTEKDKYDARSGDAKPIFIQPKNLAEGCLLKDYQLEGVRWLVSLYENGVSGILATRWGWAKRSRSLASSPTSAPWTS